MTVASIQVTPTATPAADAALGGAGALPSPAPPTPGAVATPGRAGVAPATESAGQANAPGDAAAAGAAVFGSLLDLALGAPLPDAAPMPALVPVVALPAQGKDLPADPTELPLAGTVVPLALPVPIPLQPEGEGEVAATPEAMPLQPAATPTSEVSADQAPGVRTAPHPALAAAQTGEGDERHQATPHHASMAAPHATAEHAHAETTPDPVAVARQVVEAPVAEQTRRGSAPAADAVATGSALAATAVPVPPEVDSVATPTRTIDSVVGTRAWSDDVATSLRWMVGENHQRAELRLNPRELGPIEISVRMEGREATVTINAHHAVTADALEQALPRLREAMQSAGVNLVQIDVATGGAGGDPRGHAESGSGQGADPTSADEPAPAARPRARAGQMAARGLVDQYV